MSVESIVAALRKQKGSDEDFIVSKASNCHVVTKSNRQRKTVYYFSDTAHAEIFLLASVSVGHLLTKSKVQRIQDFTFGFYIETSGDKVVSVGLSPVLYNLVTEMKVAMEGGQDCIHELVKYIS